MLLYHKTNEEYFEQILSDGKLKPSSKTKNKNENPYNFFSKYIFFNTIPKTQLKNFVGIGICFDQSILLNKVFYTNENHSAGNLKSSKKYKISDNNELTKVLYSLYRHSLNIVKAIKMEIFVLSVFQEIFTKFEPSLKDAKYIILRKDEPKLISKIKDLYPHITIIISEVKFKK